MEAPVRVTDPAQMYWYKDAIVYELHVRAFYDSNADGIGDLRGLIQKLDYLQDLGVTALWLLPFYPSPLRDDGYDIAGYTQIHPQYGTLRDFRQLLREAQEGEGGGEDDLAHAKLRRFSAAVWPWMTEGIADATPMGKLA